MRGVREALSMYILVAYKSTWAALAVVLLQ